METEETRPKFPRLARQETIVTSLEENRTNPKRFWRCFKKELHWESDLMLEAV